MLKTLIVYTLEPPQWGGSNKYTQSIFWSKNKEKKVYPCKPQFYYIKVGCKEVFVTRTCFRDVTMFVILWNRLIFHILADWGKSKLSITGERMVLSTCKLPPGCLPRHFWLGHWNWTKWINMLKKSHEKSCFLHMRKQRRRSAVVVTRQLISAFVFAT